MSLGRGIGSVEYLKKRIPKNAKYQNVKTRLDTGCSLSKYMEKVEEIKRNYRYRKDEIFKRLKVTTFSQLILQVAAVSDLNESGDSESQCTENELALVSEADIECLSERTNGSEQTSPHSDHLDPADSRDRCHTARSTLLSVISGVGELNLDTVNDKARDECALGCEPWDRPYPDCPYLLLDVRDRDQYDCCHIISAHSFPIALLSRTMNPYTKEVLAYKNAAGKIIILYDEDERVASQAATIMCQRGFENLFMLSGGLKVIAQKFPEGMVTGSIPTSCLSSPTAAKARRSSGPLPPPPPAAERRWRFTADELSRIQEQLEELQIPSNASSRMSSRMSGCSSKSTACGASSRQSSSSTRRSSARAQSSRPWK